MKPTPLASVLLLALDPLEDVLASGLDLLDAGLELFQPTPSPVQVLVLLIPASPLTPEQAGSLQLRFQQTRRWRSLD